MDLHQSIAIVTGAASGLGAQTARTLASRGVTVALLDQSEEALKLVAAEIRGYPYACDVTDAKIVEEVIEKLTEEHGAARICVNCAGVAPAKRIVGREGPMPLDEFRRVIEINLIGTFNVMRVAAAKMSTLTPYNHDGSRGVIINTASVAAFDGQLGQAAYSASKGGVVSMTLPAAREFSKFGIRVMTIAPGIMETPMLLKMPQNVQDELGASVIFPKRLGKPFEFSNLVLHIIENEYLNGEVIRLDGSIRMQ